MEKYFRAHEAFVTNIDFETLFGDTVDATVPFNPLDGVSFIFAKFFSDVWANVAEFFFDSLKIKEMILKSGKSI